MSLEVESTSHQTSSPLDLNFHYAVELRNDCRSVERELFSTGGQSEPLFSMTGNKEGWQLKFKGQTSTTGIQELVSPLFDWYTHQVPELQPFRKFLASFQFYRFLPDYLKRPGKAVRVERLDREGGNFASYLHTIQSSHKKSFARIESELSKNFPEIEELGTNLTPEGGVEAMIKERWFDRSAHGFQLSDGLAGFLAHLVALYGPDAPALVVFEEPENYIHPRLMERLVDMLKGATKTAQVMISTHSVPLINQLALKDLLIIERTQGGATTARRIEAKQELVEALKGWALGDAYASGALDAA